MSIHVASSIPDWVYVNEGVINKLDCRLKDFDASGGPMYPFGDVAEEYWLALVRYFTGIRFIVVVTSGSCLVTPEATCTRLAPEVGEYAPKPFTVAAGEEWTAPYGIDEMRLFWRLKLDGGVGKVGILGIKR